MSTVSDQVKCPQCGEEEARYEFDCRTSEEETLCTRCGYRESWEAESDEDGQLLGWKHDITKGSGVLWYRGNGGVASACHSLHSQDELDKAERWLKEQLAAGTVEEDTARLTRWNEETRRVELVVGALDYGGKTKQAVADHKCPTCGVPLPKGTKYVWQGKNRWCEKCFWGEDGDDAIKVPAESDRPKPENTGVDHGGDRAV
jgi:predicted RNA-binding Zn-ribbon protein involved in translation (DUF1610 family)